MANCRKVQEQSESCQKAFVRLAFKSVNFDAPLIIKKGGTYTGAWRSNDSKISTITIQTSENVVIKDSIISGYGDLIHGRNVNVTITNVSAFGLGEKVGKFLDVTVDKTLAVNNNRMSNVWGMRVSGRASDLKQSPKIQFSRNIAYDLKEGAESRAHFIQLSNGEFPSAKIEDNVVINPPWSSRIEDVISLYNARGTPDLPIYVRGNKILGAYPSNPITDGYSGGGIIIDGGRKVSPDKASANIIIEDNVVVATTNYGIAIASGHNNVVKDNIVVGSGFLPNRVPIKAQNIGLYVWNIYKQPPDVFFDNAAYANKVYWMKKSETLPDVLQASHLWLPDCRKDQPGWCENLVMSSKTSQPFALELEGDTIRQYFNAE